MKDTCLFCEFVHKTTKTHRGKYPFKPLHKTKHSISFLSIDFPKNVDGHTLVVPKKHYNNITEIPKSTLHDLIEHTTLITKALEMKNDATNILVNNGIESGQTIFHTHFHIIPRNKGDKIDIELWKRKKITKEKFKELHTNIKKEIKKLI
jgi:histidine triad (HIT) family protein